MKSMIVNVGLVALIAGLLAGCGQSSSPSNDASTTTPPAPASQTATRTSQSAEPPETSASPAVVVAPVAPASSIPTTTPPPSASAPPDSITASATQLARTAAAQTDTQAASIATELSDKAKLLAESATGNSDLKTKVASALQSLSSGKEESSGLGTLFQQAKQANLTPQQTQLVKEVSNLASAYVVQKNFSSVDGAQGDVANIVNALRRGSITPALPSLQSLAQNASLTTQQKDLLGTLAGQYAPGLKKAGDSLKQGLQSLQGLGK